MKSKSDSFTVNGYPLAYFFEMSLMLFVCWLLFSGRFEAKYLLMGVFFSLLSAYLCTPFLLVKNVKTGKVFFMFRIKPVRLVAYLVWLMGQIVSASIDVAGATFAKSRVKPRVIYFKMDFENPVASALLANSIILTPGTITLDVNDEGIFEIHALTDAAAEGVFSGKMQSWVASLYNETCEFIPMRERTITDMPKEVD
ncbi:MAG: Na+/H+ antiporter subunit E [Firmicutes bacterium]|nr:Na+/H+ antiporter subunit E [Bacillota bacterium]